MYENSSLSCLSPDVIATSNQNYPLDNGKRLTYFVREAFEKYLWASLIMIQFGRKKIAQGLADVVDPVGAYLLSRLVSNIRAAHRNLSIFLLTQPRAKVYEAVRDADGNFAFVLSD